MIFFDKASIVSILSEMSGSGSPESNIEVPLLSQVEGLVLGPSSGVSHSLGKMCDVNFVDPIVGWNFDTTPKSPSAGLFPVGLSSTVSSSVLRESMSSSSHPAFCFFVLFRGPTDGSTAPFFLRATSYNRVSDEEYARLTKVPDVWPPESPSPRSFLSGFINDRAASLCELLRRGSDFLYATKAPAVGQQLFIHVFLDSKDAEAEGHSSTRLTGMVTAVGPVPAPGEALDPSLPPSYFETMEESQRPDREEILRQLGTIHGQKVEAIVYLAPEQVGESPAEWNGQWKATLVANDNLQALWHICRLEALPKEQWIERIPRNADLCLPTDMN